MKIGVKNPVYIYLRKPYRNCVRTTVETAPNVLLDYDEAGALIGIEILRDFNMTLGGVGKLYGE